MYVYVRTTYAHMRVRRLRLPRVIIAADESGVTRTKTPIDVPVSSIRVNTAAVWRARECVSFIIQYNIIVIPTATLSM